MDIRMAPKLAIHNKANLSLAPECACYYCFKVFKPSDIVEYVDRENDTALCPHCSVDAVLPIYEESEKEQSFLAKLHNYWFSKNI